jgi:hypothetical protein
MPSKNYRYYRTDGVGRFHTAEWLEAESDLDAISQIEAMHPHSSFEIWQGQRFVAKLGNYSTSKVLMAQSHRTMAEARRILDETEGMVMPPPAPDSQGDAR